MIDTENSNVTLYLLAFFLSLTLTAVIVRKLIPMLKSKARQPIYEEGPDWHIKKSGTPTMGGLGYLISISVILAAAVVYLFIKNERYFAISLILTASYGALNSLIGFIDDIAKIRKNENAGLSPLEKIVLQALCAVLFLLARGYFLHDSTSIKFASGSFDIGFLY